VLPVVSLSCIQCMRLPQLPSWAPHPALAQSATIMLEGQDTTHSHESGYAPNMVRVWSTQISKLCCLVESKITCLSTVKTQKTVQNSRENDFNLIRETLMKCKHQDWLALEIYTRFSYLQSANGRSAWMVSKELFVISQICKVYMFTIQTWVSKLGTKKQEFITIAEIQHWGHHRGGNVLSSTATRRNRKLRSEVVKSWSTKTVMGEFHSKKDENKSDLVLFQQGW
jgi:hypothetical protein